MEKPTSQLVEEAVQAVKNGEISLENGASRFGDAWLEIRGEVAMILDLEKAGQSFKTNLPAPNLDKIWSGILPELTLVQMLPLPENAEPASPETAKLSVLTLRSNGHKPALKVAPVAEVAPPPPPPAKVTFLQKWRKPLTWAAAFILVVVISFGSLAGVASAAEPGDFFYGTKLWLDSSRQVFAFSPEDKVNAQLSYCENRSREMEWLVRNGKLEYLASVTSDYRQSIQKVIDSGSKNLTAQQTQLIQTQQARLTQLNNELGKNPAANSNSVTQASQNINSLVQELQKVATPGSTVPTPTAAATPTAALTPTITATVSATPTITATLTVSATRSLTVTLVSTTAAAVTQAVTTPGVTTTEAATTGPSTTVASATQPLPELPQSSPVGVPSQGNTAPQPVTTAIPKVATPTPTPATVGQGNTGDNSNSQGNNGNNSGGNDNQGGNNTNPGAGVPGVGNNGGNTSGGDNGNHGSPVNEPAKTPVAPAQPTANPPVPPAQHTVNPPAPSVIPPTAVVPPTQAGQPPLPTAKPKVTEDPDDQGNTQTDPPDPTVAPDNRGPKPTKEPKTEKPTATPSPTPTPRDTKKPKDSPVAILVITNNIVLSAIENFENHFGQSGS